jgi:hypothetical protein
LQEGRLQVRGLPDETALSLAFLEPAKARRFLPTRVVRLTGAGSEWEDQRANGSHLLRILSVRNATRAPWRVSASHSERCSAHLRYDDEMPAAERSADAENEGVTVPPGGRIELHSCKGSAWNFEPAQPSQK